ncbi:MAG: threonylcarbamoyl-AMP synthase [Burkholderiaceae bacterium]|jgi:L-threonylcarbamoyladenylate synthase|nr:threonylcarbamoyl-AMP synthase [Burkholderiaceae bacterium]
MILTGPDAIERTAQALAAGELAGIPTETVYGLAANAADDAAVCRIYAAKGRPAGHPLIVHVASAARARAFAADVPPLAQRLMQAFWPGPLTLILPRRADVARAAAGGQDTIGLRCPAHPTAQALLAACVARGVMGLAAPSANRFGRVSPTTAAHVAAEFGPDLLVLDGGPCAVGIESAIVDCTRGAPVLLRPGQLTRAGIERAAGERVRLPGELAAPDPRASGTLSAHYAPRAQVRLMCADELRAALGLLGNQARGDVASAAPIAPIAVWARAPLPQTASPFIVRRMPDDAPAVAQQLFAVLRGFDDAGVKQVWVETPPDAPEWEGVADRLRRAAASA